jgi:hypothetical protein
MPISPGEWHIPLARRDLTLAQADATLREVGLRQEHIPFVVQLVENPRFDLPFVDVFPGATDLQTHDYIHILLGRGLAPIDEAFVLGFTMGSSNRLSVAEQRLYEFFAQYLYPRSYRFGAREVAVYRDAVRLGFVSDCQSLATVDYGALLDTELTAARRAIGIEEDLLCAYYRIEAARYADSMPLQRLLGSP